MSTFQSIVYAALRGFSEFLPIGGHGNSVLLAAALDWPKSTPALEAAIAIGALLALLIAFIHDWAAVFSCFIQVIIYRKRPMTLDERLPVFIAIAFLPALLAGIYLPPFLETWTEQATKPYAAALLLVVGIAPLLFTEYFSRHSKGMFDWNWKDSLIVGIFQSFFVLTGFDRVTLAIPGGLSRNYQRESAVKVALFAGFPFLLGDLIRHWEGITLLRAGSAEAGITWLSFLTAFIVTTLCGLLAIGGLMKHIQRRGFGQYAVYRVLAAVCVAGFIYYRSR